MAVHTIITCSYTGIKSEFYPHIMKALDKSTVYVTEISVPGSDRKGWHVLTDELDLGDLNVEVRTMGCGAGIFEPSSNEVLVFPADWFNLDVVDRMESMNVPVEDELMNKAYEKYVDRSEGKTYFYMGGVSLFREECEEEE
ncbi:hypothetical protein MUB04_15335 [Acinetobacter indicus]|uniref:hypothetical protein n=1 Tax=Acinetobacter TaxID=469 RepID=UPI0015D3CF16|nr:MULTISPECIES: hypothetical protein [Acinetobacter]MCP0917909.1 hypothetical protein [Acinetobacter indicus]